MKLVMIRHAPTPWNRDGRIQGRADIALGREGVQEAKSWSLPPDMTDIDWHSSPLARARQTASALAIRAQVENALREMDWGDWEGETLAALRARLGAAMAENEARGLDFHPPGGESPREVQARLVSWLSVRAESGRDTGAVCHKGVIRAALSLATGWDMTGKAPVKLPPASAQIFSLNRDGVLGLLTPDLPLHATAREVAP